VGEFAGSQRREKIQYLGFFDEKQYGAKKW